MDRSRLDDLQRVVTDSIRRDNAGQGGSAARAEDLLLPSRRGQSAASRLDVYREQFWLRHLSNLTDDFPTLAWVIGAKEFHRLVAAYLEAFPPQTWDLQRLGANVPKYLAGHTPWRDDHLTVDASLLDWAFMEAFDAPDAPPLDLRPLANASEDAWTSARIELHPSVRRIALDYPVHELREAVRRNDACGLPPREPTRVVVWRDSTFILRAMALEPAAFELLGNLSAGTPLGQACEAVAAIGDAREPASLGANVGEWFRQWTASGWVSAIRLDS